MNLQVFMSIPSDLLHHHLSDTKSGYVLHNRSRIHAPTHTLRYYIDDYQGDGGKTLVQPVFLPILKAEPSRSLILYTSCLVLYLILGWKAGPSSRTSVRLLRSWVRIPPRAWMFVCCKCYVMSGRGLCDELITRPGEYYRLWCVVVCDLETSKMRRPWPTLGCSAKENKQNKQLTS